MNIDKTAELLKEKEALDELDQKLLHYINQVKTEEHVFRQLVNELGTWKSGNGSDSFEEASEDFLKAFGQKVSQLEAISIEISGAKQGIDALINVEMNKGPKF